MLEELFELNSCSVGRFDYSLEVCKLLLCLAVRLPLSITLRTRGLARTSARANNADQTLLC